MIKLKVDEAKKLWSYKKREDGSYKLVEYKGNETIIKVPGMIGNSIVTEIDTNCFVPNKNNYKDLVEEIDIDENIQFIGYISNFSNIRIINFRSIPKNIKCIGELGDKIESFGIFGEEIYLNNKLIAISKNIDEEYVVRDGTEVINKSVFEECKRLKRVTLPESVKIIEEYAFYSCDNLECINLDKVEIINENAFTFCENLYDIGDLKCLRSVSSGAFEGTGLENVSIYGIKQIPRNCFSDCEDLECVSFGEGVEIIERDAFINCENLSEITFPNSLKTIRSYAFYNCPKITSLDIPSDVDVEQLAFDDKVFTNEKHFSLKSIIKCGCGNEMFPCKFDITSRIIEYECTNCGKKQSMSFEEAKDSSSNYEYFTLNTEGIITWKCYSCGGCEFDMEWFLGKKREDIIESFKEYGCGLH